MKNFSAIILAAGKGVRMKSELPKVLVPLNGKPLIHYVVEQVRAIKEVKQIIIVIGYKGEEVRKYLRKTFKGIEFAWQKEQLGTAHAVSCAASKVKQSNTLILCGDAPLVTDSTLRGFIQDYDVKKLELSVLSANLANKSNMGVIGRDDDGKIAAITETINLKQRFPIEEVNSGIYAVDSSLLRDCLKKVPKDPKKGEYFLTDIVSLSYAANRPLGSYVLADEEEILGINSPIELNVAQGVLRKRLINKHIMQGVVIVDPATTFIEEGAKIGEKTKIFPFTFIEKNVTIGRNCSLGPFIRLREGTCIEDDARFGNFIELNRSHILPDVTMKHFGYLGDATVQSGVNIGAGTVVANYDGKNKNKTLIKEGSFIGCDSILVAPLIIGKKAMTGAGSVVTHDVDDGSVVVGVPARPMDKTKKKEEKRG